MVFLHFSILLVILLELLSIDADPIILLPSLPRKDIILSAGENITLTCTGVSPLKWSYPSVYNDFSKYTKISENERSNGSDKEILSELFISNITYPFVGDYSCKEQYGTKNITWVYLYVNDSKQLSVLDDEDQRNYAVRNSVFTVPCRPTCPDVKLTLKVEWREIQFNKLKDNVMYLYDPHIGITTNASTQTASFMFHCTYEKHNHKQTYHVFVKIEDIVSTIAQPAIFRMDNTSYEVGGDILLNCFVKANVRVQLDWITPQNDSRKTTKIGESDYDLNLSIENITLRDQGEYICQARDYQGHKSEVSSYYRIYGKNEHFINLTNDKYIRPHDQIEAGTAEIVWELNMDAHPVPKIKWTNNKNQDITDSDKEKYQTYESCSKLSLTIKNITLNDYGKYVLKAENDKNDEKILELFLNVTDTPSVQLETSGEYQLLNEIMTVKCNVKANPEAQISWYYKPCLNDSCNYEQVNISPVNTYTGELNFTSEIKYIFNKSGVIKCSADNSIGHGEDTKIIRVSDIADGFGIVVLNDDVSYIRTNKNITIKVAEGESLTLSCRVYASNTQFFIEWSYSSGIINPSDKYRIQVFHTQFSNRTELTINRASIKDNDLYTCRIYNSEKKLKTNLVNEEHLKILVSKPIPTYLNRTNINETTELNFGEKLELLCEFDGLPKPKVTWYKNNEPITYSENRISITDKNGHENASLKLNSTKEHDEGTYKCEGINRLNSESKETVVSFKSKSTGVYLIIIGCLLGVLIVALIIIYWKDSRKRKLESKLKELGLAYFEKGQIENLNSELGIEDQAELLPYDKKWEFPIANLKLGKQLGAGAFGVVCKGQAKGIKPGEEATTVAVKMVKRNAEDSCIKALVSELKIMAHLGKHLNVLNLLGACTKNVTKKELLVIVEYCKYGNIHNYLYRHRTDFINQIDSESGKLNLNIGIEKLERTLSIASSKSCYQMKYAEHFFLRKDSNISLLNTNDRKNENISSSTAQQTETTEVNMSPKVEDVLGDDYIVASSAGSTVQLEWRTNYKSDYKGSVRPICTEDLIIWAFQVARGMEYLTSRKVLHGDLAARNILLTDDNVVKICDFGLAKNIYHNDQYKMKSNCPLPIKWMAIEAIRDRVFSTQSDVWAFGVVLWELFSLAKMPYPGMEADERLYAKLVDGYRMESPEYATKEMYEIMLDCWSLNPLDRPSFTELHEKIGCLLEEGIKNYYLDLNSPYLQNNQQQFQDSAQDYLAMLSSPDFANLSSPNHYINDLSNTPGYLSMNSIGVSTPKISGGGDIFTFDNRIKHRKSNEGCEMELTPLVEKEIRSIEGQEEQCFGSNKTPETTTPTLTATIDLATCSVSNPSYSIPPVTSPTVVQKEAADVPLRPQKNCESEKSMAVERNSSEDPYVNSNVRNWENIVQK